MSYFSTVTFFVSAYGLRTSYKLYESLEYSDSCIILPISIFDDEETGDPNFGYMNSSAKIALSWPVPKTINEDGQYDDDTAEETGLLLSAVCPVQGGGRQF